MFGIPPLDQLVGGQADVVGVPQSHVGRALGIDLIVQPTIRAVSDVDLTVQPEGRRVDPQSRDAYRRALRGEEGHGFVEFCEYIEDLALNIKDASPYYEDSLARLRGEKSKKNEFPKEPGVYIILRKCKIPEINYRYKGLSPKSPIVLYVGKTTSKRTIARRLVDHFGNNKPNFQGSQFVKFLMQIVQDEEEVRKILLSSNTIIASVPVTDGDELIDAVEKLAMQVFAPRFNIKDR